MVFPSCLHRNEEASIRLKHLKIDASGEKLLAEVAETIIPATEIPGAKDTYAHLFALRMLDDCYPKELQEQFQKGLKEVDRRTRNRFNTTFVQATPAQRGEIIGELEKNRKGDDAVSIFYTTMKDLTIKGFLGSQYVLTNVHKYELVPARYNGYHPASKPPNKA